MICFFFFCADIHFKVVVNRGLKKQTTNKPARQLHNVQVCIAYLHIIKYALSPMRGPTSSPGLPSGFAGPGSVIGLEPQ